ncbi:uncharacterized protein LOC105829678 [Monomorium pharaonis]|uniref:uncharacterized protein LOC105829678 n=1 Tax=Monomorium pharaonis TaxID=307658 RepID=UPI00063F609B|nr:uncharacterized protein LOC105829678 [Monomorium pharaonis]
MRLSHVEARIEKQLELMNIISTTYDNLIRVDSHTLTSHRVTTRLDAMKEEWHKFSTVHEALGLAIRELSPEDKLKVTNHSYFKDNLYIVTRESYLSALEKIHAMLDVGHGNDNEMISVLPTHSTSHSTPTVFPSCSHQVRLPRVDLPRFTGNYSDWLSFRELFQALVVTNPSLSAVEKLQYLKSSIGGSAASLLKNTALTAANFQRSWEALISFYENKRLLVDAELHSLMNLKKMTKESGAELEQLYTNLLEIYRSLEALQRPIDKWDDFLVFIVTQCLDPESAKAWELHLGSLQEPPTWAQLDEFLIARLRALRSFERSRAEKLSNKLRPLVVKSHFQGKEKEVPNNTSYTCSICSEQHHTAACSQFSSKTRNQKLALISKHQLCFNCLGLHRVSNCTTTRRCQRCGKKHHTSIHLEMSQAATSKQNLDETTESMDKSTEAQVFFSHSPLPYSRHQVLLATARLHVSSPRGNVIKTRALIDPGSETSLISERLVRRLKLDRLRSVVLLTGVGAQSSQKTKGMVQLKIKPHFRSNYEATIFAYILTNITSQIPSTNLTSKSWAHLEGLQLADTHFSTPGPIEMLLGADVYTNILLEGLVKGPADAPIAQYTTLGWIVLGPTTNESSTLSRQSCGVSLDDELSTLVHKFWELESVPVNHNTSLTTDEQECEAHFLSTHARDEQGRYIVRLPFKYPSDNLGASKHKATLLCDKLMRRFLNDSQYARMYHEFMTEYQRLDHMRQISNSTPEPTHVYYLPHHGVRKETSLTTKLRVVFNGSSSTTSGRSLNDLLHSGAKLQVNIFDVLIWFRQHHFVFSADIEKMFRQIRIHPEDSKYQRIIWFNEHGHFTTYELTTVTYGLVCAPFLALRVLQQLTEDEGDHYPQATATMRRGRYVDDLFGGADDLAQAQAIVQQLSQLCMAGGFPLKKWISNDPMILSSIPKEDRLDSSNVHIDDNLIVHSLGLLWHPARDSFQFRIDSIPMNTVTKRIMLSTIAKIFDPLGFITPVVIVAKILLQSLWTLKVDWDQALPPSIVEQWTNFATSCRDVPGLEFPRWLSTTTSSTMELHGFCDASLKATAAVVFSRSKGSDGKISTQLICSKAKVAPMKRHTIPRLELSGAVLLTKLILQILKVIDKSTIRIYLWTDSSITLLWITNHPSRWKDFVHNRVCFIQESLPNATWNFVPGIENPADLATRGLSPRQLSATKLWWRGPPWLSQPHDLWPSTLPGELGEADIEERPHKISTVQVRGPQTWALLERYSSLIKLLRITAMCLRAKARFKKEDTKSYTIPISPMELKHAKEYWTREVQRCSFPHELLLISSGKALSKTSPLIRMTPYLDSLGILRVGGRLHSASLPENAKHPAILPKDSIFTSLVIRDAHLRSLHGGTQLTTSFVREEFWIVGGRASIRRHIWRCIICTRSRQDRAKQLMGQLPTTRVTPARPFLHAGVDYAGPLTIKTWKGKNARTYKGYVALFVCFASSAVHLELVTDYTADAFLAAYKRFSGRRGLCATLTSDCGTNLKGADTQLQNLLTEACDESQRLASLLAKDGTEWRFNPPSAPHFGGKWEAAVKSMKFHLKRVIGDTLLTYEEMTTLLTQIEAVLNSRPLCPLTDDPDDLAALTPGHFLMGCAPAVIPEPSLEYEKLSRLSRWQLLRQLLDSFWSRWSSEYLHRHHAIYKWNKVTPSIQEGAMVLVVDERYPPTKWPLGRVIRVHPGPDGLTRVVTVKTQLSELKRPVTKLCLLPTEADSASLFVNQG